MWVATPPSWRSPPIPASQAWGSEEQLGRLYPQEPFRSEDDGTLGTAKPVLGASPLGRTAPHAPLGAGGRAMPEGGPCASSPARTAPPRAGFQARLRRRLSARPAHTASSSASRSHPGSGLTRRRPTRGVPHGYTCKAHGARCPRGSSRCPGDAWSCLETLLVAPARARVAAGI